MAIKHKIAEWQKEMRYLKTKHRFELQDLQVERQKLMGELHMIEQRLRTKSADFKDVAEKLLENSRKRKEIIGYKDKYQKGYENILKKGKTNNRDWTDEELELVRTYIADNGVYLHIVDDLGEIFYMRNLNNIRHLIRKMRIKGDIIQEDEVFHTDKQGKML